MNNKYGDGKRYARTLISKDNVQRSESKLVSHTEERRIGGKKNLLRANSEKVTKKQGCRSEFCSACHTHCRLSPVRLSLHADLAACLNPASSFADVDLAAFRQLR